MDRSIGYGQKAVEIEAYSLQAGSRSDLKGCNACKHEVSDKTHTDGRTDGWTDGGPEGHLAILSLAGSQNLCQTIKGHCLNII